MFSEKPGGKTKTWAIILRGFRYDSTADWSSGDLQSLNNDLARCVECLIFSLKYGKVWKKWLIFLFWKTQKWTLWICRDQNHSPPVPWSILLTNRCEGSLNRRGLNESAVQFCPNWLSDSDFCSCTVYRMLLGCFFLFNLLSFLLCFSKKILIKVTYIHSNKILCVFLTQCLLLFFWGFFANSPQNHLLNENTFCANPLPSPNIRLTLHW